MLSDKFIDYIKENNIDLRTTSMLDFIINLYYYEFITDNDRLLLDFAFSKNPTQAQLDEFLAKWDIEVAGGGKALMLSYVKKIHPELTFTAYESPRLDGLLKFFRFKNLDLMKHYTKVGRMLNEKNGIPMIIKGGLMKHLRPDLPRLMGDIDIVIFSDEDHNNVWNIGEKLDYDLKDKDRYNRYAMALYIKDTTEGVIDVHRYLQMDSGLGEAYNPALLSRARKEKVFNVESLVPSHEDIVFIILHNLSKNLRDNDTLTSPLYNAFDCQYLVTSKPDFDWNIVFDAIKITQSEMQTALAARFVNKIVPNLLPKELEEAKVDESELREYVTKLLYFRYYVLTIQPYVRSLLVKDLFSSLDFFIEYARIKPKYLFLKKMKNCKPFINYMVNKIYDKTKG